MQVCGAEVYTNLTPERLQSCLHSGRKIASCEMAQAHIADALLVFRRRLTGSKNDRTYKEQVAKCQAEHYAGVADQACRSFPATLKMEARPRYPNAGRREVKRGGCKRGEKGRGAAPAFRQAQHLPISCLFYIWGLGIVCTVTEFPSPPIQVQEDGE
jgi:hypothetical protein